MSSADMDDMFGSDEIDNTTNGVKSGENPQASRLKSNGVLAFHNGTEEVSFPCAAFA